MIPISIAPNQILIHQVLDGEKVIAIEITNGPEKWFYDFDQGRFPSMRLGAVPRKSLDEEFVRRLIYQYPSSQPSDEDIIRKLVAVGDLFSAQRHIMQMIEAIADVMEQELDVATGTNQT